MRTLGYSMYVGNWDLANAAYVFPTIFGGAGVVPTLPETLTVLVLLPRLFVAVQV